MRIINTLLEYLLNTRPVEFALFGIPFVLSGVLALALYGGLALYRTSIPVLYRKVVRKLGTSLLWYGIMTIVFYFLRSQRIPYLSMRIWLWLFVISFWALALFVIYKEYKRIPERRDKLMQHLQEKRYLD